MSYYTDDPHMVRVDFFKPSGKWYTTEAVRWITWAAKDKPIHDAFREALLAHLDGRLTGMTAICLEPYHEHSHPISMEA